MTDEYITREDAMWAACKALCHPGARCPDNCCIEVRKVFNAIPAADVRPVVRCKYCLNWKRDAYGGVCDRYGVRLDKDWFCAGGEKKEVQDDD